MNDKLTELYRSCKTKEALASQDLYSGANVLLGSEVEKFAELIIRECSQALYYRKVRFDPIDYIFILKHFGIE